MPNHIDHGPEAKPDFFPAVRKVSNGRMLMWNRINQEWIDEKATPRKILFKQCRYTSYAGANQVAQKIRKEQPIGGSLEWGWLHNMGTA